MKLAQGDVIRAWVLDPQGGNPKPRPLVVVQVGVVDGEGAALTVAITGQYDPTNLAEDEVELPYNPVPRRALSGLTKPCVAKASWFQRIRFKDVLEIKGMLLPRRVKPIIERMPAGSTAGWDS